MKWRNCSVSKTFELPSHWRIITVLFCVVRSLRTWRSWCSRRQGVRQYHSGCSDTCGGLFEHMSEMCLFHWCACFTDVPVSLMQLLSGKKRKTNSPKVLVYWDFWIIRHQIKGILLFFIFPLSVSFLIAPHLLTHLQLVLQNLSNAQC
jgi:hypothetical protein